MTDAVGGRTNASGAGSDRVSTGLAGLDRILGGGFVAGSIYMIQGTPGAGKTILSNQICFHHVGGGGKAIFVTLLAENHARMIANIGRLSFYDPAQVPEAMRYISAYAALREAGLDGFARMLRREITSVRATMLVIDGLVSAQASAPSDQDFKMFIHDLQEIALATGCTIILTTNALDGRSPEQTMVDGLITLSDGLYGWRAESDLQVRKLRGSSYLRGRHSYQITDDGLVVYPRLEAMFANGGIAQGELGGRLASGVADLDVMLGGGLPAGSNTAVIGPSGSGKTTLGLQFLAQSTPDEPGLFAGLYEQPAALVAKAASIGHPLRDLVAAGTVEILWQTASRDPLDGFGAQILAAVARRGVRRLVIDGITAFKGISVDPTRIEGFFAALAGELRRRRVTSLVTIELPNLDSPIAQLPIADISGLSDNVLLLRHREDQVRTYRLLSILKLRDGGFDPSLRIFEITGRGIAITRDSAGTPIESPRFDSAGRPAGQSDEPPRGGS